VWEFHKLIPLLTDPARFGGDPADAFTVIAPSLPGYGFSYRPRQPRFDRAAMADLCAALVTDILGYPRFCAQGGDIGAAVAAPPAGPEPHPPPGVHFNFLGGFPAVNPPGEPAREGAPGL